MSNEETLGPAELTDKFTEAQGSPRGIDAAQMLASVHENLFGARLGAELRLGRFQVLQRIGAGGMGVVLKAYDPQLERVIALKVLKSAAGGEAGADTLLGEARSMAKVRHPNLVTVFETGVHEDEVFVAMEFVDGSTLRPWLEQNATTWKRVLSTLVPAAQGLAAVHAAGLVHRDFKPDNVLIDTDGRVQVTDFGLARASRPAAEPPSDLEGSLETPIADVPSDNDQTIDGTMVAGSPGYLSPEQWKGESATALSDQFSLCVTLYEALYGERPFPDSSLAVLADAVIEGQRRPRPSPRVTSVPSWLDTVVDRGLSTNPADRFPSLDALLHAIERGRRRRVLLLGGAALAASSLVTAAAFGFDDPPSPCADTNAPVEAVWSKSRQGELATAFSDAADPLAPDTWKKIQPPLDAYASQISERRLDVCEATRVRGEASEEALDIRMRCLGRRIDDLASLLEVLSTADPKVVVGAVAATEDLTPIELCDDIEVAAEHARYPEDPKLRARIDAFHARASELKAMENTGRWAEAVEISKTLLAEAESIGFRPAIAEAALYCGSFSAKAGDTEAADGFYMTAFEEALATGFDEVIAWAAVQQTELHGNLRADKDKADFWAKIARAAAKRRGNEPMLEASLENNLGTTALRAGDGQGAAAHFRRALEVFSSVGRGKSLRAGQTHSNLGAALRRQGEFLEALAEHARSRTILTNALGAGHPALGTAHNAVGAVYFDMGQFEEAERAFELSLELQLERLPPEHPAVGHAYNNLGEVAAARGDHDTAIPLFARALAVWEPALGKQHPLVANPLTERGLSLLAQHEPIAAAADLRRALEIREKVPDAIGRSRSRFGLARATEDPEAARALATTALSELPEGHEARAEISAWLEARPSQ